MDINAGPFYRQAELLIRLLPYVMAEECFALKGGTAINLFLRDMPRLSVDIDLTYLPIEEREVTLQKISSALETVGVRLERLPVEPRVHRVVTPPSERIKGLWVRVQNVHIRIEPNEILRGSVFPCEIRELVPKAQETFSMFVSAKTLSRADLYGGKICAALDRQHPRDLYDVKGLFEEGGITEAVRKAFVVYLASHHRPMHELIDPHLVDFRGLMEGEFMGLTVTPVTYEELVWVRDQLIARVQSDLTRMERKFLISVKEGTPAWDLLGIPGIEKLPGIAWKVKNIKMMSASKHREALGKLKAKLGVAGD